MFTYVALAALVTPWRTNLRTHALRHKCRRPHAEFSFFTDSIEHRACLKTPKSKQVKQGKSRHFIGINQ